MKREQIKIDDERELITGLIVSNEFCSKIVPVLDTNLLETQYARYVASWAKEYYNQYKKPIEKHIIQVYAAESEKLHDDSLKENVLAFITNVDKKLQNSKTSNDAFTIDRAVQYLKKRSMIVMSDKIQGFIDRNELEKAEHAITNYRRIQSDIGRWISIPGDGKEILEAYTSSNDILFKPKGVLGRLTGNIHREDLIAIVAPLKRGKSWWLMWFAEQALVAGLKVAYFSLEMSENEIKRRFWTSLTGQVNEPEKLQYPYFVKTDEKYELETKEITAKYINNEELEKSAKDLKRMFRTGEMLLRSYPAQTLSVNDIDSELENLYQETGFIPDVLCIDYVDILVHSKMNEYRHSLNDTWLKIRGLAQKRKCAVITPAQANRESLDRDMMASDTSEDIRKLQHVTAAIGLNQNKKDLERGIMRVTQLAIREGQKDYNQVVVTQCLGIGRPVMECQYIDDIEFDSDYYENDKKSKRKL